MNKHTRTVIVFFSAALIILLAAFFVFFLLPLNTSGTDPPCSVLHKFNT